MLILLKENSALTISFFEQSRYMNLRCIEKTSVNLLIFFHLYEADMPRYTKLYPVQAYIYRCKFRR